MLNFSLIDVSPISTRSTSGFISTFTHSHLFSCLQFGFRNSSKIEVKHLKQDFSCVISWQLISFINHNLLETGQDGHCRQLLSETIEKLLKKNVRIWWTENKFFVRLIMEAHTQQNKLLRGINLLFLPHTSNSTGLTS